MKLRIRKQWGVWVLIWPDGHYVSERTFAGIVDVFDGVLRRRAR